jgi:hypothetical protein
MLGWVTSPFSAVGRRRGHRWQQRLLRECRFMSGAAPPTGRKTTSAVPQRSERRDSAMLTETGRQQN